ncbi:MAG TPA: class I SAM-dependent methyltransferase [Gemmataceae bacterium]|nr:class I SAM-dependent methyltransferase [Gemmataceae bacterium]
MAATQRIIREQIFYDRQAKNRAVTFRGQPEALVFTNDDYLDHETWIRPALGKLGDLKNLKVLDFGCGHGMAAVVMARLGARVIAFDLSGGYVKEAGWRARANKTTIDILQADGEKLPFADKSFDRIWGNAILHHLNAEIALVELRRVLKPDGLAVFCEPWGENRLLTWLRKRIPYSGKHRTPDEEPLRRNHLRILDKLFEHFEVQGFQILGMARRFLKPGRMVAGLDWCDAKLLAMFPALIRFCRYIVITFGH